MKTDIQNRYISKETSELFSYINFWKRKLKIQHYHISLEKISESQVCDDDLNTGNEFVGIYTDHENLRAYLLHTRELKLDDVIHELLHVKYPQWTDEEVSRETEKIMKKLKPA